MFSVIRWKKKSATACISVYIGICNQPKRAGRCLHIGKNPTLCIPRCTGIGQDSPESSGWWCWSKTQRRRMEFDDVSRSCCVLCESGVNLKQNTTRNRRAAPLITQCSCTVFIRKHNSWQMVESFARYELCLLLQHSQRLLKTDKDNQGQASGTRL